jgi:serine protease Do
MRIKGGEGALVADVVQGDPADKAGIRTGDVITEIDHRKVKDSHELLRIVASLPIGKKVEVKVLREGKTSVHPIVVSERGESVELAARNQGAQNGYFGMTVQDVTPEIAEYLGLTESSGVVVTGVRKGSPAQRAGIRAQDVILQVNKAKISSMKDYKREMAKKGAREKVMLLVKRGKNTRYIPLQKN